VPTSNRRRVICEEGAEVFMAVMRSDLLIGTGRVERRRDRFIHLTTYSVRLEANLVILYPSAAISGCV
jgi:hypothetical protein